MIITLDTNIEHNIHMVEGPGDATSWWLVRVYGGAELVDTGTCLGLNLEEATEWAVVTAIPEWERRGLIWVDGDDALDGDEDMMLDPVDR